MKNQPTTTNSVDAAGQVQDRRVPNELYSSYIDERKTLCSAELDLGKSFDKWILTLAGGALGLSITFANEFSVGLAGAGGIVLAVAWVFFGGAIMLALMSVYQSPKAHEDFRDIMDQEMEVERSDPKQTQDYWARVRARQLRCPRWRRIPKLNLWSLGCFMFGVLAFCVSVFFGISQGVGSVTSGEAKSTKAGVEKVVPNQSQPDGVKKWVPLSDKPLELDHGVKPAVAPVGQGPEPTPEPTPKPGPAQDGK
jgi:hypothetical protein